MAKKFGNSAAILGLAALSFGCVNAEKTPIAAQAAIGLNAKCAGLLSSSLGGALPTDLTLTKAEWQVEGTNIAMREGAITAPAHCLVEGYFDGHDGVLGGPYKTAFRMRLPEAWNGKFFFQGGGGSNGVVGEAVGPNGAGNVPALQRGYAVIAQDSGHDNETNNLSSHQGQMVFGFDPKARANYGHASLKPTYDIGRKLVRQFYQKDSQSNIFWGCSKGGQEGMAFAQRYPEAFDGIVAMAPGMSLPRAALAQTWDTQSFARIPRAKGEKPSIAGLKSLYSPAQIRMIKDSALSACDSDDGAVDGIIGAVGQCTTEKVEPELRKRQCKAGGADGVPCLDGVQIDALVRSMEGPKTSEGQSLYAAFPWDSGLGTFGWSMWKWGVNDGPPSLNVLLGGGSLAAVFTSPPTALGGDPEALLAWQLGFDFDRDAGRIYAVEAPFVTSAWQDVGMRNPDLSAFRARGGKLIIPHGVSDPVFSVLDTMHYWDEVNTMQNGTAADFVRVFPVPGMNHCGGGPATDQFDSLGALEQWVDSGKAPDFIPATAGPNTPWPGRSMPLCPHPMVARATDNGQVGGYRCFPSQNKE